MHLTITNVVKCLFGGGFKGKGQVQYHDDEDHKYIRGDIETRGPCPGLNALANQGYLYVPQTPRNRPCIVLTCNQPTGWEEHPPPASATRAPDGLTHGLARSRISDG